MIDTGHVRVCYGGKRNLGKVPRSRADVIFYVGIIIRFFDDSSMVDRIKNHTYYVMKNSFDLRAINSKV